MKIKEFFLRKPIFFYYIFFFIFFLFLLFRFTNLLAFPIFNDEGIYTQYSQFIHEDFSRFKFISMENAFYDWKPPLQFWLGSFFVTLSDNPLFNVRFFSVLFSLLGFFGIFFSAKILWGRIEALIAVFLWTICSFILFYDMQFVSETFVFSSGALVFAFFLSIIKSSREKIPFFQIGFALFFTTALFLFKQSSVLLMYLYLFIPFFFFPFFEKAHFLKNKNDIKIWIRNSLFLYGSIIVSFILYHFLIPERIFMLEKQFSSRWVFSLKELLNFPTNIWKSNFLLVFDLYSYIYGFFAFLLILFFIFFSFVSKKKEDLLIAVFFIISSLSIIFLLKGFNQYIYHTGVIVFLILGIARIVSTSLTKEFNLLKNNKIVLSIIFICFIFSSGFWTYQTMILKFNPIYYLERSTSWMKANYLTGWSSGYGVPEIINLLKKEPPNTVALIDDQWGNPGTSIQVFSQWYPQVSLYFINKSILEEKSLKNIDKALFNKLIIFARNGSNQEQRDNIYNSILCLKHEEIRGYGKQSPIIVCNF